MFRVSYPNASRLKQVVQALAKLSDELPLYVTQSDISVKVLSPDKTMLVVLNIPSLVFEEYTVDEEATLIVPATEFRKVVRRATRNDTLILAVSRETNELIATLRDRKTGIEREFRIPLVPKPPEPVPELQVDLSISFSILSQDLKNIVGDLKLVGEEATFIYEDGKITIKASEQQKEYICELREGSPLILLTSAVDRAAASYNIEMLLVASQPVAVSKSATVSFDSGKPMKIEYELEGGGKLVYWIVPRL